MSDFKQMDGLRQAVKAKRVDDSSVIFLCSTCWHYRQALMRGEISCGIKNCGGPFTCNRLFPEYRGLDAQTLKRLCYICGEPASFVITDGHRYLGLCEKHKAFIEAKYRGKLEVRK